MYLLVVKDSLLSDYHNPDYQPRRDVEINEINLHNDKWLINCSNNPHKDTIGNHLRALIGKLDLYSSSCSNFILLADFNIEVKEQQIKTFCDNYGLKNLIRQPTYYKSPSNPTCIYLILTNAPQKFQSTCVLETGLSDFHLMTVTVMKN